MSIENPIILYPAAGPEIRTNSENTAVSGTTVVATTNILYKYAVLSEGSLTAPTYSDYTEVGISFAASTVEFTSVLPWSLDVRTISGFDVGTVVYLQFYAQDLLTSDLSIATPYVIHKVVFDSVPLNAPTPSGVSTTRNNTAITVETAELLAGSYLGVFVGFNFYISLMPGGGVDGYQKANDAYITDPGRIATTTSDPTVTTSISDGIAVETRVSAINSNPMYQYTFTKVELQKLVDAGKLPNLRYSDATDFYFVVTSVVFSTNTTVEVESLYSQEVKTRFLSFVPSFTELPARSMSDILLSMGNRLTTLNRSANLVSGSTYRDLLDPISEELASAYIVQDFISRSQTMDGLLQLDDANGDGVSDTVSSSPAKKRLQAALYISNDQVFQNLLDSAFDKNASNYNITRMAPTYAVGQVVFYVSTVPSEGLYINDGAVVIAKDSTGSAMRYTVIGSKFLYANEKDRFYNQQNRRYEIACDIKAVVTGASGNVQSGAVNVIASGADARWKVTNPVPLQGGSYTETNNSLANRAKLAISGLDSGTEGGYLLNAISVPGVKYAQVVTSGDPMMHRDLDPVTGRHVGGKVDVYVQGTSSSQWQETIAFSYSGPTGAGTGERFLVEDAESMLIRTTNPAVTVATPIFEPVLRVTNLTRGASYDVSGAVAGLGDGDSIMLSQNSTNLKIGMSTLDIIEVDYRYRGYNSYVLGKQPVNEILSVQGDQDNVLPPENYKLVKLEDPMYNGDSTVASDGLEIIYLRGRPSTAFNSIYNEAHTLLTDKPVLLVKKGVDTDTLVVSSDLNQINVFDKDLDYKVVKGGTLGQTQLVLTAASRIRSGTTVYVSYAASQNFTVVYTYNQVLQDVQTKLDSMKHAAADVTVKQAVGNDIDISVRVLRKSGHSENDVRNAIVNGIAGVVQNLKIGTGFNLDDMVNIVKNTTGVKTLYLPPYRMMKANGSFISSDTIGLVDFQVYNQNAGMGVTSYLSVDPVLSYGTAEGGGDSNLFRSIYEDGYPLVLAASATEVSSGAGRGYIRGDGRIVVSTKDGMPPQTKEYKAAYYTYVAPANEFSADIHVGSMEYLTVGVNSITVDASAEETTSRSS